MKGQQITPWSIYNQQNVDFPLINDQKTEDKPAFSIHLPKVTRRVSALDYHHYQLISHRRKNKQFKMAKSAIENTKLSISKIQQQEKNEQEHRKSNKKQANLLKELLQKQTILMIIKQDLREGKGQSLLFQPFPPLQVDTKPEITPFPQPQKHYFHLDNILVPKKQIKLPKVSSLKQCIVQNCSQVDEKLTYDKNLQQQLVHKLLKEKIEAMISQKMKVLSNRKQLTNRSMVYNFSYKNI